MHLQVRAAVYAAATRADESFAKRLQHHRARTEVARRDDGADHGQERSLRRCRRNRIRVRGPPDPAVSALRAEHDLRPDRSRFHHLVPGPRHLARSREPR